MPIYMVEAGFRFSLVKIDQWSVYGAYRVRQMIRSMRLLAYNLVHHGPRFGGLV